MNLSKTIKAFFVALFAIAIVSCSTSPEKRADQELNKILKQFNAVGIGAAVVKDGRLIYNQSVGYKNLENKIPLKNEDIFRIASISKSFTATGIMQLVDQKKLSLDDDISDLIGFKIRNPYFPEKVITLRMIMSHTSSMSDAGGYFSLDPINPAVTSDNSKSFNNYEPGTKYEYCNLGYNLTGSILEKVSGVRFDKYVKANIIEKLGLYGGHNVNLLKPELLVSLYDYTDSLGFINNDAEAYEKREEKIANYTMGYSAPIFSPTGGVKISPKDLAKYMIMHINYGTANGETIISKESSQAMQEDIWKGEEGSDEYYGLALRSLEGWVEGKKLKGHTGSAYGVNSIMIFSPEEGWGIVAMTNGCNYGLQKESREFLKSSVSALYNCFIK